jgi:hypothetical protein
MTNGAIASWSGDRFSNASRVARGSRSLRVTNPSAERRQPFQLDWDQSQRRRRCAAQNRVRSGGRDRDHSEPVRPIHCVEFGIYFVEEALDFCALVGTWRFFQTAEQVLLSRQQRGYARHWSREFAMRHSIIRQ